MQLLRKRSKPKARKQSRKPARKPVQRFKREGAGRPSLHPGKVVGKDASAYLTQEGWDKLAECRELLLDKQKMGLKEITVSDAIEEGIHRMHKELTRAH